MNLKCYMEHNVLLLFFFYISVCLLFDVFPHVEKFEF